jgi:hypothetical protein
LLEGLALKHLAELGRGQFLFIASPLHQALTDAGLTIEAIDGIVVGCNDQLDGRASPS